MVDKIYSMSSFLQFRMVYDTGIKFAEELDFPRRDAPTFTGERIQINNAEELFYFLKSYIAKETADGQAALALSGGIDSATCAKFMPKGSVAYTFKCVVPGVEVIDETARARQYCDLCDIEHRVVEIYWEDYLKYSPILMKRKNAPIHSIEVQIYKAALQAKKDGFSRLLFADSADMVFGGLNGLLSKDYTIGEYIDRFSYVLPYKTLKDFNLITTPFKKWCKDGIIDSHGFLNDLFSSESTNSYYNACSAADIAAVDTYLPLCHMPLDIPRIQSGDSKYIVRELFQMLFPGLEIPEKIPMARPMAEWLKNWTGPKRLEFWENCHMNMSGDQKYYIWILESFLNLIE